MGSAQPEQSRLMQAALKVIEAYNTWDLNNIMATRAPECTTHILPSTLYKLLSRSKVL